MTSIAGATSLLRPNPFGSMRQWPPKRWAAALAVAGVLAILIGIPTGVVPNPLYHRMTPTTWWNYPVWAISALLGGLTAATYLRRQLPEIETQARRVSRRSIGATVFAGLAVGCPICNKVVVALVGISGALNYWAPLQPLIGVLSIGLLLGGLIVRLRGETVCKTPGARGSGAGEMAV